MNSPMRWLGTCADRPELAAQLIVSAAAAGNLEAQAQLGQILLDGRGIERDAPLAFRWFQIAARAGHVQAYNMLGRCLQLGWGCEVQLSEAARCYLHAAQAGLDWAMYNYANMLAKGWGVERDMRLAFDWYSRAADRGHAKAMNLVGRYHEEGWLGIVDLPAAFAWYQRSAQAGDFRGQCSYASRLVALGRIDEAQRWLERSMAQATVPFLMKMADVLQATPHEQLQRVSIQMRERARQVKAA